MTRSVVIMYVVAAIAAVLGVGILVSSSKSEAGVYRRRIAGTMLVALGCILAVYAYSLNSWSAAS